VTGEKGLPLPPLIPVIAQQDIRYLVVTFAGIMVLVELVVIAKALSQSHSGMLRGY